MSNKHIPERSCVVCRKKRPKSEFVRWHSISGVWKIGRPKEILFGRGIYICADSPSCWQEKRLKRVFGTQNETVAHKMQMLMAIKLEV